MHLSTSSRSSCLANLGLGQQEPEELGGTVRQAEHQLHGGGHGRLLERSSLLVKWPRDLSWAARALPKRDYRGRPFMLLASL